MFMPYIVYPNATIAIRENQRRHEDKMYMIKKDGTLCSQTNVILPVKHKDLIREHGYTVTGICREAISVIVEEIENEEQIE